MLFEIELPPGEEVTFVKEDTDNKELKKYMDESSKLRDKVKETIKIDKELKYVVDKIDTIRNGNYLIINGLDILHYIYDRHSLRRGLFLNNDATYPKIKFNSTNYAYLKDHEKPGSTRLTGNLYHLQHIHKYLEVGGNASFKILDKTNGSIAFPYLLKLFFKKVNVFITGTCIALEYNGKQFKETNIPTISTIDTNDYIKFVIDIIKENILINKLTLKSDKKPLFQRMHDITINMSLRFGIPLSDAQKDIYIFSLQAFQKDPSHYTKYISGGINTDEGMYLYKTILSINAHKMIEVGLANGVSSAYILIGAKQTNGHLISIDPFQKTQWKSGGLNIICKMKLKSHHTWIEDVSHKALPRLLDKKGAESSYDLIFIDGFHTFDYTLVDAYFADKLLRVGGVLIVDDFLHKGVNASMKYIMTNWSHYKRLKSPHSFAAFEKISEDKRDWDFHKTF
jgi:predicted O-methyltransferase YrrM